jgi:hypothetical protein
VNIRGQYLQRSNKQQRTRYMLSQLLAQRTVHIALVSQYRFTQACILVLMHSQYLSSHAHTSPAQHLPRTDVFDIADLRSEALHCIIKTTALLADLGGTLALLTPVPFDLSEQLRLRWGWYKPQSGYEASTAAQWARNVSEWGPLLKTHPDADTYISTVQAMSIMIAEANAL